MRKLSTRSSERHYQALWQPNHMEQLRPKSLKQIAKYKNGKILTKSTVKGGIRGMPTEPLPLAMLRLDI